MRPLTPALSPNKSVGGEGENQINSETRFHGNDVFYILFRSFRMEVNHNRHTVTPFAPSAVVSNWHLTSMKVPPGVSLSR